MRRSDVVDVLLEVLPRRAVRAVLLALLFLGTVFHWWAPVLWYISDKAARTTEFYTDVLEDVLTDVQH